MSTQQTTLPAPCLDSPPPPCTKWEREYKAFLRLLPQLLQSHRGQFVAIHNEQVVDTGDDDLEVALRALAKIGNVDIHVGLVTDVPEPIYRSGIRRVLSESPST